MAVWEGLDTPLLVLRCSGLYANTGERPPGANDGPRCWQPEGLEVFSPTTAWNWILPTPKWAGNGFSPRAYRKEGRPVDTLILALWDPCQSFDLENYKIINTCCFKPLNLWLPQYRKLLQTPIQFWAAMGSSELKSFLLIWGECSLLSLDLWTFTQCLFHVMNFNLTLLHILLQSHTTDGRICKNYDICEILLITYWKNKNNKKYLISNGVYNIFPAYHLSLPLVEHTSCTLEWFKSASFNKRKINIL